MQTLYIFVRFHYVENLEEFAVYRLKDFCFKSGNYGNKTKAVGSKWILGGASNSGNLGGWVWGHAPQIILKSRTPEIRFPASREVIFYRKAHYKLEVWERVDRD